MILYKEILKINIDGANKYLHKRNLAKGVDNGEHGFYSGAFSAYRDTIKTIFCIEYMDRHPSYSSEELYDCATRALELVLGGTE